MTQLDTFTNELHEWTLTGKEPECASRELRHYLDLQEKRLQKLGIEREEEFEHVGDELRSSYSRESGEFTSKMLYREARQVITYKRNGKQIKRRGDPVNLYAVELNRPGQEDPVCTCPNCGHQMTASQAVNGCIYCHTYFEADDTYPCFTSYFTVPMIVERATLFDRIKKEEITVAVVAGLAAAGVYFFSWEDIPVIYRILGSLFMGALSGGMAAISWYMIRSILLLICAFREAFKTVPMLPSLRSRKKMNAFMKKYDPDFSYEYFEGRVLSLFRTTAFSGQRDKLSIWTGDRDLSFLDPAADIQYRGALQVMKCRESDGILQVDARIFLHDVYYRSGIREKNETFRILLEKEPGVTDDSFSIHKVTCAHCGGSFDALHQRNCPYCGNPYELRKKDWVIRDIRKG